MKPEKIVIIPAAHNYVSVNADGNRLGGDTWIIPHITAIRSILHSCLDQHRVTTVIADKAYNGPKVLQWLSDMLPPNKTITQTYDAFGWLEKDNKKELFDTQIARPQNDTNQLIFVVASCSNELIREFLGRKTNIAPEVIETIQDTDYRPQIGKAYVIDNNNWSIQYL